MIFQYLTGPLKLSDCQAAGFAGLHESKDDTDKLLGGMGNGNIVVFSFRPFLGKVSCKGGIPVADELRGVEQCIAEVTGTTLLHVGISIGQLARLVSPVSRSETLSTISFLTVPLSMSP